VTRHLSLSCHVCFLPTEIGVYMPIKLCVWVFWHFASKSLKLQYFEVRVEGGLFYVFLWGR